MLVLAFGVAAVGGAFALGYGLGRVDGKSSARAEFTRSSQRQAQAPTKISKLKSAMRIRSS